jgi:glycosyltransferase involved in cell wall biosynthesis
VIGEQFRESPPVFEQAREAFRDHIDRWGYQESRAEYEAALREADVIVSTAEHEFFGISVVEAIAAGAYPVLPRRLAYPEIVGADVVEQAEEFFYDGHAPQLASTLAELAGRIERDDLWQGRPDRCLAAVERFTWDRLAPALDDALDDSRA